MAYPNEGEQCEKSMILRRTIIVLLVYFATTILLILTQLVYAGARGYAVLMGIFGSSLIALLVWSQKTRISNWSERQQFSPKVLFILLGSCGAAAVEIIFWLAERVFNTSGVAASSNLLVDLLVTMPWYLIMLVLLLKVEAKYHYSLLEIFVLGGIYEAGADGVLAPILAGKPITDLVLLPLVTPLFMVTYSPIVMTPTIALSRKLDSVNLKDTSRTRRYFYGLLPLFGLIPYAAIFGILPRLLSYLS